MTRTNRQWVLASRPAGEIEDDTFEWREGPAPEPGDGEVLVRNLMLSFDPTQRGWLNDTPSYIPPVQIGEVMRAGSVGQVIESNSDEFAVGDLVQGTFGWQDYAIAAPGAMPSSRLLIIRVSTGDGLTVLTRIPDDAHSRAAVRIMPMTACLLVM